MQFLQILKDYKNPIFKLFKRIIKILNLLKKNHKNPKIIKMEKKNPDSKKFIYISKFSKGL